MSQDKNLAADQPTEGGRKRVIDWEAIERDYRAGIMSLRAIGEKHGVTHGAIRKRAAAQDWPRDLTAKIQAQAEKLVSNSVVSSQVSMDTASEREIIQANAQMQADIILAHRKDVPRARQLMMALMDELEQTTGNRELFEQLGELMFSPDEKGIDRLNELYRKVVSMSGRIDSAKKLADALKTCVGLEREVFGIGGDRTPGQTLDDFLDAIAQS